MDNLKELASTLPVGSNQKVGVGFDVHRLVKNRPLILGGVSIPNSKGLLGHSDADVLTHAIMDSLLSAAAMPDIGALFPDTSDTYKDAVSIGLLEEVVKKISERGFIIINVSCVIMAQKPKLQAYILLIRERLSKVLGVALNSINISATTTEALGIIGKEKGIAAAAVCLLSTTYF